jgi:hypothetical protein
MRTNRLKEAEMVAIVREADMAPVEEVAKRQGISQQFKCLTATDERMKEGQAASTPHA